MFKLQDLLHLGTEGYLQAAPVIPRKSAANPPAKAVLDTACETVSPGLLTGMISSVLQVVIDGLQDQPRTLDLPWTKDKKYVRYHVRVNSCDKKVWIVNPNMIAMILVEGNVQRVSPSCADLVLVLHSVSFSIKEVKRIFSPEMFPRQIFRSTLCIFYNFR